VQLSTDFFEEFVAVCNDLVYVEGLWEPDIMFAGFVEGLECEHDSKSGEYVWNIVSLVELEMKSSGTYSVNYATTSGAGSAGARLSFG
jgi:hypothetical protein